MKRIYMDLTEEQHKQMKQCAKDNKRTLKGFLEVCVSDYLFKNSQRKEVKKTYGKK